jgi:energy-coupling factor transporter transmembrane protein EcfT
MKATSGSEAAWALIEAEKRRDRFIRRLCIAAWTVTFILVLIFAVVVGSQLLQMMRAAAVGAVPTSAVWGSAMPLLGVLWTLSLLVAALSTVGVFLRFRTASLSEIQLRLATLEEMLASQGGAREG